MIDLVTMSIPTNTDEVLDRAEDVLTKTITQMVATLRVTLHKERQSLHEERRHAEYIRRDRDNYSAQMRQALEAWGNEFHSGGKLLERSKLTIGSSILVEGGRWLVEELARVEAERDTLRAILDAAEYQQIDSLLAEPADQRLALAREAGKIVKELTNEYIARTKALRVALEAMASQPAAYAHTIARAALRTDDEMR